MPKGPPEEPGSRKVAYSMRGVSLLFSCLALLGPFCPPSPPTWPPKPAAHPPQDQFSHLGSFLPGVGSPGARFRCENVLFSLGKTMISQNQLFNHQWLKGPHQPLSGHPGGTKGRPPELPRAPRAPGGDPLGAQRPPPDLPRSALGRPSRTSKIQCFMRGKPVSTSQGGKVQ